MGKRNRIDWNGMQVSVAPPEYVILRKMEYFVEGGSEKHLLDIQKILAVTGSVLDRLWLEERIQEMDLASVWKRIQVG
jgi:hypothetical protein